MRSSTLVVYKLIHILNSWWSRPLSHPQKVAALASVNHNVALENMGITDDDIKLLCENT
jgi:hypothetical protein